MVLGLQDQAGLRGAAMRIKTTGLRRVQKTANRADAHIASVRWRDYPTTYKRHYVPAHAQDVSANPQLRRNFSVYAATSSVHHWETILYYFDQQLLWLYAGRTHEY